MVNQGGAATSSCVSQNTVGNIRVSENLPHTSFKRQIIIRKLQLYYKKIKTPSLKNVFQDAEKRKNSQQVNVAQRRQEAEPDNC